MLCRLNHLQEAGLPSLNRDPKTEASMGQDLTRHSQVLICAQISWMCCTDTWCLPYRVYGRRCALQATTSRLSREDMAPRQHSSTGTAARRTSRAHMARLRTSRATRQVHRATRHPHRKVSLCTFS